MSNVVSHRTGHPRLRIDFRGADAECVSGASTEGSGRAVQPVPVATSRRRSPGYRPMQLSRCVNAPEAPSTDAIAIRPMIMLSLSFDHRVIDGATADQFMAEVQKELEGWPL